ncbi:hypothetical protein DID96_03555 [Burkholderia sp. Bp8963]|nr:hypothetical protein DID96_03555 [Burkholderia sp. Bp8963]
MFLDISGVHVERLQDISEADAHAEGMRAWRTTGRDGYDHDGETALEQFADRWSDLNSVRGYGWNTNSWVWVIEFATVYPC